MAKLYPPCIENALPAFAKKDQAVKIAVPFQLNRAVSRNDFKYLAIIIKTVSTGTIKVDGEKSSPLIEYNSTKGYYIARFDLPKGIFDPAIGQYYKIQVAFCDTNNNDQIGYYSSVATIKCIAEPEVSIRGLSLSKDCNQNINTYVGEYSQKSDPTEKVYSYRFDVYTEDKKLIATSNELLHDSSTDTDAKKSIDEWTLDQVLDLDTPYHITYSIKTINGYETKVTYPIMEVKTRDLDNDKLKLALNADNIADEGYVNVYLTRISETPLQEKNIIGYFILLRSSDKNNFKSWSEVCRFNLLNENAHNKELWKDFSVEQGVTYRYAIQAYNEKQIYSNRLLSKDVSIDFEDCFLYDGERQLKIRFNPKISSFKRTLLESKVDTLGGKHPFIFRNGRVDYKEFSISGLISLISDSNEFFMKGIYNTSSYKIRQPKKYNFNTQLWEEDKGLTISTPALKNNTDYEDKEKLQEARFSGSQTDLTAENYYNERQFKLEALEWLSDGKPKLFRSAAEGNYIVRLMNVSLSPVDALGRMLHNFQCTAYEIADCTFANLEKYGFIKGKTPATELLNFDTIDKKDLLENKTIEFEYPVCSLNFFGFYTPLTIFKIYYISGGNKEFQVTNSTGNFNIESDELIEKIELLSPQDPSKLLDDIVINYAYFAPSTTSQFANISDITIETEFEQYIGNRFDRKASELDIINLIEDVRKETGRFYYIAFMRRDNPIPVWENNNNYYYQSTLEEKVLFDNDKIYQVMNNKSGDLYLDGSPDNKKSSINYKVYFNNNDYTDLFRIEKNYKDIIATSAQFEPLLNVEHVSKMVIGDGIEARLSYQLKTFTYSIEDTNEEVRYAKKLWQQNQNNEKYYQDYIKVLEAALKEEGETVYAI